MAASEKPTAISALYDAHDGLGKAIAGLGSARDAARPAPEAAAINLLLRQIAEIQRNTRFLIEVTRAAAQDKEA